MLAVFAHQAVPLAGQPRDVGLSPDLLCHKLPDGVQILLPVLLVDLVDPHVVGELVKHLQLLLVNILKMFLVFHSRNQ